MALFPSTLRADYEQSKMLLLRWVTCLLVLYWIGL